ncbi:hypothetical protein PO124_00040 [Bacillus licheniformis]|nr:hypothetical protein [Bacillus licheniformis]
MAGYTPMIQQYLKIKAEYQDAFYFSSWRLYEMFLKMQKASQELEITLTSRDGGSSERIPMCGVPYHSCSSYIEQLIKKAIKSRSVNRWRTLNRPKESSKGSRAADHTRHRDGRQRDS